MVFCKNIVAVNNFHGSWNNDSCMRLYGDLGGVHSAACISLGGANVPSSLLPKYLLFFEILRSVKKMKIYIKKDRIVILNI